MSQENVEITRKIIEAFNERGFRSEGALSFFDESVIFEEPPEQPAPRVARGREEAAQIFGQFDEAWETHVSDPQEFIVVDNERVLVLTIEHFRGRDGIELSQPCGNLFTLRDGKVVRMQSFWERGNALEAAGLAT
ncbi:MAG: nuclear transport factor 2 family protein [Actinomycetota bacterium]|nr:nuclear transport factor 2 family protein [Actinomycetota bacterium]